MGIQSAPKRMALPPPGKPLPGKERRAVRDNARGMGVPTVQTLRRAAKMLSSRNRTHDVRREVSEGLEVIDLTMDVDDDDNEEGEEAASPGLRDWKKDMEEELDWMAKAVRPVQRLYGDFRLSPEIEARKTPWIDYRQHLNEESSANLDHNMDLGSPVTDFQNIDQVDIPVRSRERQPSEDSVALVEEKAMKTEKNEYGFRVKTTKSIPIQPPPQSVPPPFKGLAYPRATYPTPARTESTCRRGTDSVPPRTRAPTPAHSIATPGRELNEMITAKKAPRKCVPRNTGKVSKAKKPTQSVAKPSTNKALSKNQTTTNRTKSSSQTPRQGVTKYTSHASNGQERGNIGPSLRLADISNLGIRMKVAQLMAITPEIPIFRLYDLVLENGDSQNDLSGFMLQASMPSVRQGKICQDPVALEMSKKPQADSDTLPAVNKSEDEDVKIKIDLNDPDIWLDNDMPDTPPPSAARQKKSSAKKPLSQSQGKSQQKSKSMPIPTESAFSNSGMKSKQTSANKAVKKYKNTQRERKSNSIERDFIVSADDSHPDDSYDESSSSSDTDDEELDKYTIKEDLKTNLHIDMIRPFHVSDTVEADSQDRMVSYT